MTIFKSLFCNHDYEIIHNFKMDSQFDMLVKVGKTPNTHVSFKRLNGIVLKCKKCSKLKKVIVVH